MKPIKSEWHSTPSIVGQHFVELGASRQQAFAWKNVDPDPYRNMAFLSHNKPMSLQVSSQAD